MHWFNVRCLIPGYAVHVGIVLSYIKWWAQFLFKGWVLRAEKCWIRIFTQATTPLSIKRSHLQTLMNVSRATRSSVPWPRTLWQAGWSRDWSTELLISRRPAPQTPHLTHCVLSRTLDSTRCWKQSSDFGPHWHNSIMWVSHFTTSAGLRPDERGGHLSAVSSSSYSRHQTEMIRAWWHDCFQQDSSPSEDGSLCSWRDGHRQQQHSGWRGV